MSSSSQLNSFINRYKFLSAISSKSLYPESKGSGLEVIKINSDLCEAHICPHGAHILYFKPKQGSQFLWLSPNCDFSPEIPLRGGIPLCLPWFGPHPTDSTKPKHGFARIRDWQLTQVRELEDKTIELVFLFEHLADSLFSQSFCAEIIFRLNNLLTLELTLTNQSTTEMDCSFAFHSYHPVKNLALTKVLGLINRTYLDNLEGHAPKTQTDEVTFPGEVDRVFPGIDNFVEISGVPHLKTEHKNCPSVIVWNCGPINAQKVADIGAGNEQHYICVERGAVLGEKWILAPQESQTSCVKISEVIK